MPVKKLSKTVIESWPEIFEDVSLNVVPIQYLCSIHVKFKDQKIWDINIKQEHRQEQWQVIEKNIQEIIKTYKKNIESIDFKLDTDKIKKDISRTTHKFLRSRRLK